MSITCVFDKYVLKWYENDVWEADNVPYEAEISAIARIHSDFPCKFGIPRQSGIVPELTARIVFEPQFRDVNAVRGLEGFSHIWLIWQFSEALMSSWSPTVRPPRLGGNERMGVFATRSPFRPNSLGLSCVKLERVELDGGDAPAIVVSGADLMDGTPIFDIKPYVPYADSHPEAVSGFAPDSGESERLKVEIPAALLPLVPDEKLAALRAVLSADPRPRYHSDPGRIYGLPFAGLDVRFSVSDGVLTVTGIVPLGKGENQ